MSKKYKFKDNSKTYFVTFTVINWIDLFIRNEYRDILLDSLKFCQQQKELEIYGWCIMTSHVHLIIGSKGKPLPDIMRDLKRHSAETLHKSIMSHPQESRREWLLWMMQRAGKKHHKSFQLWQPESHPIELSNNYMAHQKLTYIHNNPVSTGFVVKAEEWMYSSATDYYGGKGLLEIIQLEPLLVLV